MLMRKIDRTKQQSTKNLHHIITLFDTVDSAEKMLCFILCTMYYTNKAIRRVSMHRIENYFCLFVLYQC